MKKIEKILDFTKKSAIILKEIVSSEYLKNNFKKEKKDFTRNRKLTFDNMLILLLQKWVKSLQLRLNEFFDKLNEKLDKKLESIASDVAFIKARLKILPEVFLKLNIEAIINRFYDLKENKVWFNTFWDFRILAIDGSKIRLPEEKEITEKFWKNKVVNRNKKESYYTSWLLSVLYDPLNNLALDSVLERWNYSERALAIKNVQNLDKIKPIENKDLIIFDRGYFSSFLISILYAYNKEFVIRLRKWAIKEIDELFKKDCKINEKIITLKVENKEEKYESKYWIKIDRKIQEKVMIRIVRIVLDNGEIELLATSLLEIEKYKYTEFKELYYKRWWIELYYDVLKNRLWLENFSWKSVHSVLQDLYSTIFLSNFETIMTRSTNYKLEQKYKNKKNKNKQKVNKQVSFNTIKNAVIELFLEDISIDETIIKIMKLFETNTTQIRPWRKIERWTTAYKSLNYHKRKKKHCF